MRKRKEIRKGRLRRVFKGQQGQGPFQLFKNEGFFFSAFGQLLRGELQSLFHSAIANQLDELLLLKGNGNRISRVVKGTTFYKG